MVTSPHDVFHEAAWAFSAAQTPSEKRNVIDVMLAAGDAACSMAETGRSRQERRTQMQAMKDSLSVPGLPSGTNAVVDIVGTALAARRLLPDYPEYTKEMEKLVRDNLHDEADLDRLAATCLALDYTVTGGVKKDPDFIPAAMMYAETLSHVTPQTHFANKGEITNQGRALVTMHMTALAAREHCANGRLEERFEAGSWDFTRVLEAKYKLTEKLAGPKAADAEWFADSTDPVMARAHLKIHGDDMTGSPVTPRDKEKYNASYRTIFRKDFY